MEAGFRGAFVISWNQTEIDGQAAGAPDALTVGSAWRWRGGAIRVDGPGELLSLGQARGAEELRRRAARRVRQLVGAARQRECPGRFSSIDVEEPLLESGFVVTDGLRTFTVTAIRVSDETPPLLMMLDDLPPPDAELWVVHCDMAGVTDRAMRARTGGIICFTPGTRLRTPGGTVAVEDLAEGDAVQTRDAGTQAVRWIGRRRMTGARLHAMPGLRPVRIRAGAIGEDEPEADLVVSPDHRVLVRGERARALFNTPEVLVAARDLIDDRNVTVAHGLRDVTYIHVAFDAHQIVWANGMETESFHPANSAINSVSEDQLSRLYGMFPDIETDPHSYGAYARRNLSRSEAAILCSETGTLQ